jgi:tetratricopeptide (TPR) repeat protein
VAGNDNIDAWRVLDDLGDLVDKSLVLAEQSDVPRCRLLETTRAFALGKLADAGEVEVVRRAHAQAMLEIFEATCRDELTVPLLERLARHAADMDNLRVALDWCFGPNGDRSLGVALASASAWVWREGGAGRPEGLRRRQLALGHVDAQTPPMIETRLCIDWTHLASPQVGDIELTRARRGVELCRAMQDAPRLALALGMLAMTHSRRHENQPANDAIEEQRRLLQPDWPPYLRARALLAQGFVSLQNDAFELAMAEYEQAYHLAAGLGDPLLLSHSLTNREQCAAALGQWKECVDRGRELVALIERYPGAHPTLDAIVAGNLCMALIGIGAIDEALEQGRRARPLFERFGHLVCLLDPLASLAYERGFAADAARIMGCADAGQARARSERERVEAALHASLAERLSLAFGPDELRRLVEEGATLSVQAAASLALRDDAQDASSPAWPESPVRAAPPDVRESHPARA